MTVGGGGLRGMRHSFIVCLFVLALENQGWCRHLFLLCKASRRHVTFTSVQKHLPPVYWKKERKKRIEWSFNSSLRQSDVSMKSVIKPNKWGGAQGALHVVGVQLSSILKMHLCRRSDAWSNKCYVSIQSLENSLWISTDILASNNN